MVETTGPDAFGFMTFTQESFGLPGAAYSRRVTESRLRRVAGVEGPGADQLELFTTVLTYTGAGGGGLPQLVKGHIVIKVNEWEALCEFLKEPALLSFKKP